MSATAEVSGAPSPTLCLCMMVKNESHVVARALRSIRPYIDYWIVCDTGSTDSTIVEVLNALSGVPGQLHRTNWVNFGHNRTRALQLARDKADYSLIMDADMVANVTGPFKHKLTADCYEIRYTGELDYVQTMLVANRHEWAYRGVTHEYIWSETAILREPLEELLLVHHADGGMRADKFERDIRLLTQSVANEPDNARDTFYLAQSYFDLRRYAEALPWYLKRAAMGGWSEEQWYALYRAACCRHNLGESWEDVLAAYVEAYNARPWRQEPLYEIVKHYRESAGYDAGYRAGVSAFMAPYPADKLFIDRAIHRYAFNLEFGVCAYGAGRLKEAIQAFNLVLRCGSVPPEIAESALRGRRLALNDLYKPNVDAPLASNRIVVICPFFNPGEYLKQCVESLRSQDFSNFEVIFVDDASTDGSSHHIPEADPRFRIVRNPRNLGAARNVHHVLTEYLAPDDIAVCLDGDDWLADSTVLSRINRFYNEHDCWVMYGQFQSASGNLGFSEPFACKHELTAHRTYFRASHIRTFRAGLFHAIAATDPEYSCLKDDHGEWLRFTADCALMFPLIELAGFNRTRFQQEVLYVYNDLNPLCQHRLDRESQLKAFERISQMPQFEEINDYHDCIPTLSPA